MNKRDLVATGFDVSGLTWVVSRVMNSQWLRGPIVRAVNYHATRVMDRASFVRQIRYLRHHFEILDAAGLTAYLDGGRRLARPGLLLTFDDGFKNHYTVAADVLDEEGVPGFFFLPAAYPDLASHPTDARTFAGDRIFAGAPPSSWSTEDFLPMSWADARDLVRRGHTIGCHTMTHQSIGDGLSPSEFEEEIVIAQRRMEDALGTAVRTFCWPFGAVENYSARGFALVQQTYDCAFTTFASPLRPHGNPFAIDRSNIEAVMPLARVRAAVGGITEWHSASRRRRFEAVVGLQAP